MFKRKLGCIINENEMNSKMRLIKCVYDQEKKTNKSSFLNICELFRLDSNYPHLQPDITQFANYANKLHLNENDSIVLFGSDIHVTSRSWFTLKYFGFKNIHVLNSFSEQTNQILNSGYSHQHNSNKKTFEPNLNLITNLTETMKISYNTAKRISKYNILNLRNTPEFALDSGIEYDHETYGSIAYSVPFKIENILNSTKSAFKTAEDIKETLISSNIDLNVPFLLYSNRNFKASTAFLALEYIGITNIKLYDGGWLEYVIRILKKFRLDRTN